MLAIQDVHFEIFWDSMVHKQVFGGSLFKLLINWHTDAHCGKSQTQLNKNFDTIVEPVRSNIAGGGRSKSKSRR